MVALLIPGGIDVPELRRQRNWLLKIKNPSGQDRRAIDGLVNLCDALLDAAEGFA